MNIAMLMKYTDGTMWALYYDLSDPSSVMKMIFKIMVVLAHEGRVEILTSEQWSSMQIKEEQN